MCFDLEEPRTMNADESPTDIPLRAVMATCTRVGVAVVIKGKVSSTHDFQIEIMHQVSIVPFAIF